MFESLVDLLLLCKQMMLDTAAMLLGNVTDLLEATIPLLAILAGVIYDIEDLTEQFIVKLIS